MVEPYCLYFSAPNKTLEFANDIDSDLGTGSVCGEADFGRFNFAFECAKNFGNAYIKALDRNTFTLQTLDNAQIVQDYTKVYTQDPSTTLTPTVAPTRQI